MIWRGFRVEGRGVDLFLAADDIALPRICSSQHAAITPSKGVGWWGRCVGARALRRDSGKGFGEDGGEFDGCGHRHHEVADELGLRDHVEGKKRRVAARSAAKD